MELPAYGLLCFFQHFDKCFIGCSPEGDQESSFCGQMGAVYVFSETLSLQKVNSMYCLGPEYQSQFKYDMETELPEGYKKVSTVGWRTSITIAKFSISLLHFRLCNIIFCIIFPAQIVFQNFLSRKKFGV